MAYPTGLEEARAGTLSAHPGYECRWGENGREKKLYQARNKQRTDADRQVWAVTDL